MSDTWVKDVLEVTKRKVNYQKDGYGPLNSKMSVQPGDYDFQIKITIGALWSDRKSNLFTKESLGELIEILTEIKEAEWN